MAIARTGPLIGAISGRIGSTEVAFHGSQLVLKTGKSTVNRATTRQLAARAKITAGLDAWAALPPGPNQAWHVFAASNVDPNRLGVNRPLTAVAWFCRWYNFAANCTGGMSVWLRPPPGNATTPSPSAIIAKAEHPSTLTVQTLGAWPDDGTAYEQLLIAPLLNYAQAAPKSFISLGWQVKTDDNSDWSAALAATGIELLVNARFGVKLRWCWTRRWGSVFCPAEGVVT